MADFAFNFINTVRREATKRPREAVIKNGSRTLTFVAYDWGMDTFVFEKDIWKEKPRRAPVLMLRKSILLKGTEGYIMTVSSGNHAVALMPLLGGQFWNLGHVPAVERTETLRNMVLCANIVDGNFELSPRENKAELVFEIDEWLRGLGWPRARIIIADRNDDVLRLYRHIGQEWRVKPLVWTRQEMDCALAASRTTIRTKLMYYHSARGIHFLAYPDFSAWIERCRKDPEELRPVLDELAAPQDDGLVSTLRYLRYHAHHEVELFGIPNKDDTEKIVSEIEATHRALQDGATNEEILARLDGIRTYFRNALESKLLANSANDRFVESMYKHLTGEIYYSSNQDIFMLDFDDRKTALPGATYRGGKADVHLGADARTRAILDYVQTLLSHDEIIEYINVYELRIEPGVPLGRGATREIVFKTNRRPISTRILEKRLAHQGSDYASYMLVRVQALQALGVSFGKHYLLARTDEKAGDVHYFIRERYAGYVLETICRTRFKRSRDAENAEHQRLAVLQIAELLGQAAAETLVEKKYIATTDGSPPVTFGTGNEIIDFGYDVAQGCEMPTSIRLCAVRGSLGWPETSLTQENLDAVHKAYIEAFARCMVGFWRVYAGLAELPQIAERFGKGFENTMRRFYWNYVSRRDPFDRFDPMLRRSFKFRQKWAFVLWSLEQHYNALPSLAKQFSAAIDAEAAKPAVAPIVENSSPTRLEIPVSLRRKENGGEGK